MTLGLSAPKARVLAVTLLLLREPQPGPCTFNLLVYRVTPQFLPPAVPTDSQLLSHPPPPGAHSCPGPLSAVPFVWLPLFPTKRWDTLLPSATLIYLANMLEEPALSQALL